MRALRLIHSNAWTRAAAGACVLSMPKIRISPARLIAKHSCSISTAAGRSGMRGFRPPSAHITAASAQGRSKVGAWFATSRTVTRAACRPSGSSRKLPKSTSVNHIGHMRSAVSASMSVTCSTICSADVAGLSGTDRARRLSRSMSALSSASISSSQVVPATAMTEPAAAPKTIAATSLTRRLDGSFAECLMRTFALIAAVAPGQVGRSRKALAPSGLCLLVTFYIFTLCPGAQKSEGPQLALGPPDGKGGAGSPP